MSERQAKAAHTWERDPLDWYQEPAVATELLLTVERVRWDVWDPACGGGNIVTTVRAAGLFAELPPSRVWVVTPRVSCPPGSYLAAGNKAGNGSSDWCWLVWDLRRPTARPEFGWLRRD